MVQVDIFWSYGIGAGFALTAGRQLLNIGKNQATGETLGGESRPFINRYFITSLLYSALLFAPSGIYLLWQFTSWETMHVWDRNLSPLLVVLFAITNVTQSILGFWVVDKLLQKGKTYLASFQVILGYFLMFFILVHGWDGTGYQRFFSATKSDFLAWQPSNAAQWVVSDVAITLYVMGVFLIPSMLYFYCRWLKEGYSLAENIDRARADRVGWIRILALFLITVFVLTLGAAIIASLLIRWIGWILGTLAFLVVAYVVFLRKGGLMYMVYRGLMLD